MSARGHADSSDITPILLLLLLVQWPCHVIDTVRMTRGHPAPELIADRPRESQPAATHHR